MANNNNQSDPFENLFDDDEFSVSGAGGSTQQDNAFSDALRQSGALNNSSQTPSDGDGFGVFDPASDTSSADLSAVRKDEMKTSTLLIIFGIVAIIIAFIVVASIGSKDNKNKDNNKDTGKQQGQVTQVQQTQNNNSDGWVLVQADTQIDWQDKKINSIFTITDIKNYVKVLDGSNLMIKTKLTGTLSGFIGTYELEIPYTLSNNNKKQLEIGDCFNVKVEVGVAGNKKVVGEISYD